MRFFFTASVLLLSLTSCGKFLEKFDRLPGGSTKVSFGLPHISITSGPPLNGGMLVYIVGTVNGYKQSLYFANESAAIAGGSVVLPNGTYKFYAFGYNSGGMTANARCGLGEGGGTVNLTGASQTIDFDMSAASCADTAFAASSNYAHATYGLKGMDFVSCSNTTDLSTYGYGADCSSVDNTNGGLPTDMHDDRGNIHSGRSFKVTLNAYGPTGSTTGGISSSCITGSGTPVMGQMPMGSTVTGWGLSTLGDNLTVGLQWGGSAASSGFWTSTDNGASFPQATDADTNFVIKDIAGDEYYAVAAAHDLSSGGGVYESFDGGESWSLSSLPAGPYKQVATYDDYVLALDMTGPVQFSDDLGDTWTDISTNASLSALIASPQGVAVDENGIYVLGFDMVNSSEMAVVKSTDDGATWTNVAHTGDGTWSVRSFRVFDDEYYIGSDTAGLFYYNGSTWTQYCGPGGPCPVSNRVLSDSSHDVWDILVGDDGKLYVGQALAIDVADPVGPGDWGNNSTSNWNQITTQNASTGVLKLAYFNDTMYATYQAGCGGVVCYGKYETGNGANMSAGLRLPVGSSNFLSTTIQVYSDPGCANPLRTYHFPTGLGNAPLSRAKAYPHISVGNGRLFLKDF